MRKLCWFALLLTLMVCCGSREEPYKPNVLIIVVDALRLDRLGCYGYERPTSPQLDALADNGVRFTTAITQASWTKSSFASILTSLYPFQHGITDWESILPDTLTTLAETMLENGYHTACVMNIVGLSGRFKVLDGFSVISEAGRNERDATETTEDVIRLIKSSPRPFFLMVHYFDTHWPYKPPMSYAYQAEGPSRKGLTSDRHERVDFLYDGCVRYVDTEIGKIISYLRQNSSLDSTVIVVTADHGESLGEHGRAGHLRSLFDEVLRVPLLLSFPNRLPENRVVQAQVRLVDILPTIVELAGVSDTAYREGSSLVGVIERKVTPGDHGTLPPHVAYAETGIMKRLQIKCLRTPEWKVIVEPATSFTELYNLETDSEESQNLWSGEESASPTLLKLMNEIPGVSLRGWRLAFTGGAPEESLQVTVRSVEGSKLSVLRMSGQEPDYAVLKERTSLEVVASQDRFSLLVIRTEPAGMPIDVTFSDLPYTQPEDVYVGQSGKTEVTNPVSFDRDTATGIPDSLNDFKNSRRPAVLVWWVPGGDPVAAGESSPLTSKERKHLRALGYLQ